MSTRTPTWHPRWSPPELDGGRFEVIVTHPSAALTVMEVVGGLDIATCPRFDGQLDHELRDLEAGQVREVIVDFTGLELLSAAGVGSVLRAERAARVGHIRLQWVITRTVARVLTLCALDDRLCVQPDLAAARRAAA